jgi:hypothetical protein
MAVRIKMAVFWVITPCSDSLPWWWRQHVLLQHRLTSTRLHGATTQKTAIFMATEMSAKKKKLDNLQHSMWLIPENRSCTMNSLLVSNRASFINTYTHCISKMDC